MAEKKKRPAAPTKGLYTPHHATPTPLPPTQPFGHRGKKTLFLLPGRRRTLFFFAPTGTPAPPRGGTPPPSAAHAAPEEGGRGPASPAAAGAWAKAPPPLRGNTTSAERHPKQPTTEGGTRTREHGRSPYPFFCGKQRKAGPPKRRAPTETFYWVVEFPAHQMDQC
jgi:hypothetical protein